MIYRYFLLTFNTLVVFLFYQKQSMAQTAKLEVIASAGTFYSNSNYNVTWTVGEPVIKTIGNATHFMTQGFNQTQWVIVGVWNPVPIDLDVSVYPNPMSSDLNVSFPDLNNLNQNYRFIVYDMLYKPVFEAQILKEEENYDLSFLSNGTYLVHVMDESGNFLKTFKIIKNR